MYNASFEAITIRFHLMIAITVIPFVIGLPWLSFLVVPVAASMILGITFKGNAQKSVKSVKTKTFILENKKESKATAA